MRSGRSGPLERIVFDTSTLVGAVLRPRSKPALALRLAGAQAMLVASSDTIAELNEVLSRTVLDRYADAATRARFFALYREGVMELEVSVTVTDCRDPKDDKFLSLALSAGARVIISSDNDLLILHPWRGIAILSPAQFVVLADAPGPRWPKPPEMT